MITASDKIDPTLLPMIIEFIAFEPIFELLPMMTLLLPVVLLEPAPFPIKVLLFPVEAAFLGLSLLGLGLAPVFPCLMSRTPQRLGPELSSHAIGFQVGAAMIGAAAVPGTLGVMAGIVGLDAVPIGAVVLFGILSLLHEGLVRRPDAAPGTFSERTMSTTPED